jgi:hypothetical protein
MTFRRVLSSVSLAAALGMAPVPVAMAQFGGMIPGMPGMGPQGGFGGGPPASAPSGPPPACQQLIALRDEMQKNGEALRAANERKAPPPEACKLFKVFLATDSKFLQSLQTNQATCGVPASAIKNVQEEHGKVTLVAKQVCDVADHPRPTGPTLNEQLNAKPVLPELDCTKDGRGIYDTLQCNQSR